MRGRHGKSIERPRYAWRGAVALVTVMGLLTGAWFGTRAVAAMLAGCESSVQLSIAAPGELTPVLREVADNWASSRPQVNGRCVDVDVSAVDSATMAAAVAGQAGLTLDGLGRAPGTVRTPQVWIPDSSLWLTRLQALRTGLINTDASSVASSPVVLAVPQPIATTMGWPAKQPRWPELLQRLTVGTQLVAGTVDPVRDASGLYGLISVGGATARLRGAGEQALVGTYRTLAANRSAVPEDLLSRFPRSADPAALAGGVAMAPLPEWSVARYNQAEPQVPLVALHPTVPAFRLDYPYTVLPDVTGDEAAAAEQFRGQLTGNAYRDLLAKQGLRASFGLAGRGFPIGHGISTEGVSFAPLPDPAAVQKALSTWTAISMPGRMLAVIDVSGSMAAEVPGTNGMTRQQVTVDASRRALALFDDSWTMGLWTFSTNLDGDQPYRELLPIGPLSSNRGEAFHVLDGIQPKIGGGTGLYDTVLAAYRAVQAGWAPGRVNSVVVMTDGQNQNPDGLTLDQLLVELRQSVDPNRPIQLIALGVGPDADQAELERITDAVDGATFLARDPTKINEIFLSALALRPRSSR